MQLIATHHPHYDYPRLGQVTQGCEDGGHFPPSSLYFPPGVYRHVCPTCKSTWHVKVDPPPTPDYASMKDLYG